MRKMSRKKTNEKNQKEKGKTEEDEVPKIKYNNDIRDLRSVK